MWTEATRDQMAKIEKKANRYSADQTGVEWGLIEPLMPKKADTGLPRQSPVG